MVQALAGKAPNVTVVQQSGDPGGLLHQHPRHELDPRLEPAAVRRGRRAMDNSTFSTSNFNGPDDAGEPSPGRTDRGHRRDERAADINRATSNRWRS